MQESNSEKRTLILVGNGFDLSFDMKTSYANFVTSEHFKKIKENGLVNYIYNSLRENDYKWVDVEIELYRYSRELESKYKYDEEKRKSSSDIFKKDFHELTEALNEYLLANTGGFDNGKMKSLIEKQWILPNEDNNCNVDLYTVISFNYTHPAIINFFNNNRLNDIRYIHGRMDYNKSYPIVLGIDETQIVIKEHAFLYKSMNEQTKAEGYNDLVKHANRIIIYGCSIGETDYSYFSTLFKGAEGKQFEIYYFKESGKKEIKERIKSCAGNYEILKRNNKISFFNCEQYSMSPQNKFKRNKKCYLMQEK